MLDGNIEVPFELGGTILNLEERMSDLTDETEGTAATPDLIAAQAIVWSISQLGVMRRVLISRVINHLKLAKAIIHDPAIDFDSAIKLAEKILAGGRHK